jgi:hypothetical protein
VFATHERGHIDIPTGDILNGRIGRLAKRQRSINFGFEAVCRMAWLPKNPKPDGVSVLVLQTGE